MELIEVMEPVPSQQIVSEKGWLHQIKWDGIRGISYIENAKLRVFTKNGNERTDFYPELMETLTLLKVKQAVLDGEIVVFDGDKPSFSHILVRERVRSKANLNYYLKKYPAKYIVFDILFCNGKDLRKTALNERKAILLDNLKQSSIIAITDDFVDGNALFALMKKKNYEGIVSKKENSLYLAGKKHNLWFKTKVTKKILAVIGGLTWKNNYPNSLMLGIYHEDKLYYIGKASSGLKQSDFRLLKEYGESFKLDKSPFINLGTGKNTSWLKPVLTCWVSFLEWTSNGSLRHPKILGFSSQDPQEADGKEYVL